MIHCLCTRNGPARLALLFLLIFPVELLGQTSGIKGTVSDALTNEPIAFANVVLDSSSTGTVTDINGNFQFTGLKPGSYNIQCTYLGYAPYSRSEITVSAARPTILRIMLEPTTTQIQEIEVRANPFERDQESPLSLRTISATEIYRSPGGNRDISKVIQTLPGVATTVSFRNDIIVRGGAPNENRFYLDGIEVPNINHFATQGSSGGPVGMINVNFIREVDFYAGAFPSNRGNALSSVMEFKQIIPSDERISGTFMVGSSDAGLTIQGPAHPKSEFIFSVRRSYLQLLFQALALPFLPTYNDLQYKQTINFNRKHQLSFIGLGALDQFELNKSVNDNITDPATIERNKYILGNLPVNDQWNYTVGTVYKHFGSKGYQTLTASRSHLDNRAIKYKNNIPADSNLLLDYRSQEIGNRLRFEQRSRLGRIDIKAGTGYMYSWYTNSTFNRQGPGAGSTPVNFSSNLGIHHGEFWLEGGTRILDSRLGIWGGLRTDFNSYSAQMSHPLDQISPRISASLALNDQWNLNAGWGLYYQLPPYTVLGYRDSLNRLVNRENGVRYIQCQQRSLGTEYMPAQYTKLSWEGFYKTYAYYPFSVRDSVSLANLGGDFGVIGNEEVKSTSQGRAYGIEFLAQQKLSRKLYGLLSYTYVLSRFEDKNGQLVASAWDNRHILNLTAGRKLPRNWEFGFKFRYLGGGPYTPYDLELSSRKEVWDANRQGLPDWDRLNSERFPAVHGMDVRVDKRWYSKRASINLYLDIQNAYNFQAQTQPYLNVRTNDQGQPLTDPSDPGRYQTYFIENSTGTLLPSVGIMIEF